MSEILTISDLCSWLKMEPSAVYSMTRARHRARYGDRALPYFKINGSIRFRKSDIEAWLDRLAKPEAS
jgi:predicted DNA-binding transcriptional regulator AlpA